MATVYIAPTFGVGFQAFDAAGVPLNAGLLYSYSAGTTTPLATYTASDGVTPNANPIVLGADGRPPNEIWMTAVSYRFDLKDSLGNTLASFDNVPSGFVSASTLAASTGAAGVGFIQSGIGAKATTVQGEIRDLHFNSNGFGTLQQTIDAAGQEKAFFPAGTNIVTAALTAPNATNSGIVMEGVGAASSILKQGYAGDVLSLAGVFTMRDIEVLGVKATYASGSGIKVPAGGWAYIRMDRVASYSFSEYGMYFTDANLACLTDCITNSNTLDGLYLNGSGHVVVSHDSESNGGNGITCAGNNMTLINPFVQNNTGNQISLTNGKSSIIGANLAQTAGNTNAMINLAASDVEIHNPLVVSQGGATYVIDVNGNRNIISGVASYPIRLQSGATDNVLIGATAVTDSSGNATNSFYGVSGTWTPGLAINGSATGITYADQSGTYTRCGNMVLLTGRVVLSSKGVGTGAVTVTGVPFTLFNAGNNYSGGVCTEYSGFAAGLTTAPMVRGIVNTTTLQMIKAGAGASANIADTDITDSTYFHFQVFFRI